MLIFENFIFLCQKNVSNQELEFSRQKCDFVATLNFRAQNVIFWKLRFFMLCHSWILLGHAFKNRCTHIIFDTLDSTVVQWHKCVDAQGLHWNCSIVQHSLLLKPLLDFKNSSFLWYFSFGLIGLAIVLLNLCLSILSIFLNSYINSIFLLFGLRFSNSRSPSCSHDYPINMRS